jgi:catechol 2,3-dioxygenase-like lactoylglutathione lyase family enzyme
MGQIEKLGNVFYRVQDMDAAVAFYQHLGFRPLASRPQSLFLPTAEAGRRLAGRGAPVCAAPVWSARRMTIYSPIR